MFHHLRLRGQCIDETAALKGDHASTIQCPRGACVHRSFLEIKWYATDLIPIFAVRPTSPRRFSPFCHTLDHCYELKATPVVNGASERPLHGRN